MQYSGLVLPDPLPPPSPLPLVRQTTEASNELRIVAYTQDHEAVFVDYYKCRTLALTEDWFCVLYPKHIHQFFDPTGKRFYEIVVEIEDTGFHVSFIVKSSAKNRFVSYRPIYARNFVFAPVVSVNPASESPCGYMITSMLAAVLPSAEGNVYDEEEIDESELDFVSEMTILPYSPTTRPLVIKDFTTVVNVMRRDYQTLVSLYQEWKTKGQLPPYNAPRVVDFGVFESWAPRGNQPVKRPRRRTASDMTNKDEVGGQDVLKGEEIVELVDDDDEEDAVRIVEQYIMEEESEGVETRGSPVRKRRKTTKSKPPPPPPQQEKPTQRRSKKQKNQRKQSPPPLLYNPPPLVRTPPFQPTPLDFLPKPRASARVTPSE